MASRETIRINSITVQFVKFVETLATPFCGKAYIFLYIEEKLKILHKIYKKKVNLGIAEKKNRLHNLHRTLLLMTIFSSAHTLTPPQQ